ncbi:MAG: hypothetical protein V4550_18285 [Gemmatimonadota bacterium]
MIDLRLYRGHLDVLHTEGLLEVVDYIWNKGWRSPTGGNLRLAEGDSPREGNSSWDLPQKAVVAVFQRELPDVLRNLEQRYSNGHYVIIARDGDAKLEHILGRRDLPSYIHHMFAVYAPDHPRITSMPFALRWASQVEGLENIIATIPRTSVNKVLVAHQNLHWFRPGHERRTANAYFRDKPWATVYEAPDNQYPMTNDGYLRALRSHDFFVAASGDGNADGGIERQAMWEGLALGCIPICTPRQAQWCDMPIYIVPDWTSMHEAPSRDFVLSLNLSLDRFRLSYWIERIREKASEL